MLMQTISTRIREIYLKRRSCGPVPSKQGNEILLLAGHKEGLKFF